MIIVKIIGGLGNQMPQYSLGRHLAILNKTNLKLDISTFQTYKLHNYGLNRFNIQASLATPQEIRHLKTSKLMSRLGLIKPSHLIEKKHIFDKSILQLRGSFYLEGYWHTEKYFKDIEDIIRNDFQVKETLAGKNKEVADMIVDSNSISLHVRRGDYVTNPINIKIYNTFGLEYYYQAAEFMAQRINNPRFFIFSDDMPWVKENLKLAFPTFYVDHNQADKNYEDLRLMSLCQHNIIANSSFSWWGAWLNNNKNKLVIAPKKLFNIQELLNNDIIPDEWIRI